MEIILAWNGDQSTDKITFSSVLDEDPAHYAHLEMSKAAWQALGSPSTVHAYSAD